MSLTIFSKHDQNIKAKISYSEFMRFRVSFAKAYNEAIGYCYEMHANNFTKDKEIANHADKMFEGIFKIANTKTKQVMLFLCKKDSEGSTGKTICKEIIEHKEKILNFSEEHKKKSTELILEVIKNSKDHGIRWC